MSRYDVELRNRDKAVVRVDADEFLLDSLEAAGIRLPFGCRFGACLTCTAALVEGVVDQSGGRSFALRRRHEQAGYVLLCVARPRADCVFDVGPQRGLYVNPFKKALQPRRSGRENPRP